MNSFIKLKPVYLLIIILMIMFAGCRSTRKIIKAPLKVEGIDYLFEQLKSNELTYNTISAKFNLEYKVNKKKTDFKGQIRIKKDSLIWISFSVDLGIEVARMLITNDSVKFINRINKTYFVGDYEYLNEFLETNIDYDVLQALIIGNDLTHYEDGKFRAHIDNLQYKLSTASRSKLRKYVKKNETDPVVFIQNIWLSPDNFKITQLSLKEIKKQNKKLQANYSKFAAVDSQLFPKEVDFALQADKKTDIRIKYSKITINKVLNFPFSVSKKYKLISKLE